MTGVGGRIDEVRAQIAAVCADEGRDPGGVRLLAVTKTRPAQTVREAYATGCRWFGENRLQELRDKAAGATLSPKAAAAAPTPLDRALEDVVSALANLGCNRKEAQQAAEAPFMLWRNH